MVLMVVLTLAIVAYLTMLTVNQVREGRYIGRPDTERDTITVSGEGRVTSIPDVGQVTVTIVTEGADAAKVQEDNITQFNKLVAELKVAGIEEKDLKTTSYDLNPRYEWVDGVRVDKGFTVNQSLSVKIRDLDNSGDAIRIASQNGANRVSGLTFTVDEPEVYKKMAREEALANAQANAEELASVVGVHLGKVVSFNESSDRYYPEPYYAKQTLSLDSGIGGAPESAPAPDFQAGSEEVIVNATIVYEIY